MAIHTELPIYKVAYDLLGVVIKLVKNMPREVKQSIGGKVRDECIEISTLVFRANVAQDKAPHLLELLERLQVAELLLRLARDHRFISTGQYAEAIALTGSIGKQANGWRKSAARPLLPRHGAGA
jgi:hypothetical protein